LTKKSEDNSHCRSPLGPELGSPKSSDSGGEQLTVPLFTQSASFSELWPTTSRHIIDVLDRGKYSHGHKVVELEAALAAYTGAKHVVGVNSGTAYVGLLGTAGGRTFTVVGDAVNLAARLESLAPVGGVALGSQTVDLVPDLDAELMGRVAVKGREEEVDVYRLVGISAR
jgi:hypothetical protein